MAMSSHFPDWVQWLPTLHEEIRLKNPASSQAIEEAERALHVQFTEELRSVLSVSNGVMGLLGCWLVWPVEEIVKTNMELRTMEGMKKLYMPFDHLLFIGDVGNGDYFAYPIMADGTMSLTHGIFRWDHEMDNRAWVASTLRQYMEGFTSGAIKA
jgi:hypothetical protein